MPIAKVLDGGPHGALIVLARHQAAAQGAIEENQSQFSVRHLLVDGHRLKKNIEADKKRRKKKKERRKKKVIRSKTRPEKTSRQTRKEGRRRRKKKEKRSY